MKLTKQKLIEHIECIGTDISIFDDRSIECWADEIWELKSHWPASKLVGYVTALVEPMHDAERKKVNLFGAMVYQHLPDKYT